MGDIHISKEQPYDNFPLWIPLIALALSIVIYFLGASILLGFGIIITGLYLLYCIAIELLVIFRSCRYCYYHNRICGMGKGKISGILTKKGDPLRFTDRTVTITDLLPDFLVAIFPLIGGVILSILDFSLPRIGIILLFLILSIGGPAFIRGSFVCKYCTQRKIGCPADQFFNKKNT